MTQTSDRIPHSQYHWERFVRPLLEEADKAQAESENITEYEWEADYGDGAKMHTEKIIEEEEEKDWIDKCIMNIPPTDYARWKALEKDITYFDEGLEISLDYNLMMACLYFFMFYSLPFLILIYLA